MWPALAALVLAAARPRHGRPSRHVQHLATIAPESASEETAMKWYWSELVPAQGQAPVDRVVTFEPDHGGWNNIRMAAEVAAAYAVATRRTLVLPPAIPMYLLEGNATAFQEFMTLTDSADLRLITMSEYLDRSYITPPADITSSLQQPNGLSMPEADRLWQWLEKGSYLSEFESEKQYLAFGNVSRDQDGEGRVPYTLTIAEETAPVVHFRAVEPYRLLTHFYCSLRAEPQEDRRIKRAVRDSFRYTDTIVRMAEAVIAKLTKVSGGEYHAIHVRKGDFLRQQKEASEKTLVNALLSKIPEHSTLYVATDDPSEWLDDLREYYNVLIFQNVSDALNPPPDPKFVGPVEQLVASRAKIFFGTWWSTFTGYIMRIRGHLGLESSSFYTMKDYRDEMTQFHACQGRGWWREWPSMWEPDGPDGPPLLWS